MEWLRRVCDDVAVNNRVVLQQCGFAGGGVLPFLVLLNTINDGDGLSSKHGHHSYNHSHASFNTTIASATGSTSVFAGAGTGTTPTHRLQVTDPPVAARQCTYP